jgi:hypothetical protein
MRKSLRWVLWGSVGGAALIGAVDRIESYSQKRVLDEFNERMQRVRVGMTETDVVAIAGPATRVYLDVRALTDATDEVRACRAANGTKALAYIVEQAGTIRHRLSIAASESATRVICLDARGVVLSTSLVLLRH